MEEKFRSFYLILSEVAKKHLRVLIDLDKREAYYCDESGGRLSDEEYLSEYGKSPTQQTWKDIYNDLWKPDAYGGFWSNEFYQVTNELKKSGLEIGVDFDPPDAIAWSLLLKINNKWVEVGIASSHHPRAVPAEVYVQSIHEPEYVLSNWEKLEKIPKNFISWV